jgi:transcriptional regulator with XRE-family HTH domain
MDELGLGVRELARQLDADKSTVLRWRKGEFLPRQAHVEALAEILHMPLGMLVAGERSTPPGPGQTAVSTAANETNTPADVAAAALIDRMAALDVEPAMNAFRAVTPDLMLVLTEAREYARRLRASEGD